MNNDKKPVDLKKVFSLNNILSQVINYAAYIIAIVSALVLIYFAFIQTFGIKIDWTTLSIFSAVVVVLVWINWNTFYRKQFEKVMQKDIAQQEINAYSIHGRYYLAIKDYTDEELQLCIDNFNMTYEERWLKWVEKYTGFPIETTTVKEVDENGNQILDENGKPIIRTIVGIKDLPYRKFKHKIIMWRIKNHKYPQSGYRTSMELMSLLSYQDSDLSKRHLRADKHYYIRKSITKFVITVLTIGVGASLLPELIKGDYGVAILKLLLALGSLLGGILGGSLAGITGARLKLSTIEEVCGDLERWANKKPILTPYKLPEVLEKPLNKPEVIEQLSFDSLDPNIKASKAAESIFNLHKLSK